MNWNPVIIGAVIGVVGTIVVPFINMRILLAIEDRKALHQRMQEEEKRNEDFRIQLIKVYNELLKLDGEAALIDDPISIDPEFRIAAYKGNIRPLLFQNLHILDREIRITVRKIDEEIDRLNYDEQTDHSRTHRRIIDLYWHINLGENSRCPYGPLLLI